MGCVLSSPKKTAVNPLVFDVYNVDDRGQERSHGRIEIHDQELLLHQLGKSAIRWPLKSLRRYGFDAELFSFESGRRCVTGPGIFAFKCHRAEALFTCLQEAIIRAGQQQQQQQEITTNRHLQQQRSAELQWDSSDGAPANSNAVSQIDWSSINQLIDSNLLSTQSPEVTSTSDAVAGSLLKSTINEYINVAVPSLNGPSLATTSHLSAVPNCNVSAVPQNSEKKEETDQSSSNRRRQHPGCSPTMYAHAQNVVNNNIQYAEINLLPILTERTIVYHQTEVDDNEDEIDVFESPETVFLPESKNNFRFTYVNVPLSSPSSSPLIKSDSSQQSRSTSRGYCYANLGEWNADGKPVPSIPCPVDPAGNSGGNRVQNEVDLRATLASPSCIEAGNKKETITYIQLDLRMSGGDNAGDSSKLGSRECISDTKESTSGTTESISDVKEFTSGPKSPRSSSSGSSNPESRPWTGRRTSTDAYASIDFQKTKALNSRVTEEDEEGHADGFRKTRHNSHIEKILPSSDNKL